MTDPSDWLEQAAREHPHDLFLRTTDGVRYSYAQLRDASGRFASALLKLGVKPGERVAVTLRGGTGIEGAAPEGTRRPRRGPL